MYVRRMEGPSLSRNQFENSDIGLPGACAGGQGRCRRVPPTLHTGESRINKTEVSQFLPIY